MHIVGDLIGVVFKIKTASLESLEKVRITVNLLWWLLPMPASRYF